MNQYEQKKQKFRRKAYPKQDGRIRDMLIVKRNLIFLQNHASLLDDWESETIKRITARVKEESD